MKRKRESIRIWVIGRKLWITAGCLILVVAMFWVVNIPTAVRVSSTTRELPIYSVQRDQKMVAISFDAAWADVSLRTWERFCSHVRISFFRASHPAWMFQQRFALCASSLIDTTKTADGKPTAWCGQCITAMTNRSTFYSRKIT